MSQKRISVVSGCFNEEGNVRELYIAVRAIFAALPQYSYEHIFIDNASTDRTVDVLRDIAAGDPAVKVIVNARNFGVVRSGFHALLQAEGDAAIAMASDLQDPPELIPRFLEEWEKGFRTVLGVKAESAENGLMFRLRSLYYNSLARISETEIISGATGFGLYDRSVVAAMRALDEPYPFVRGLLTEIGFDIARIPYRQPKRAHGYSKMSWYTLYDIAFQGVVNHSKLPLRLATIVGFGAGAVSMLIAVAYLIAKLVFWDRFQLGVAPILIGFFLLSSIQLFFIGIVGEYVGSIYTHVKQRPLVFEKERINF